MRLLPSPPLIILLDVLFVFLFILILDNKTPIEIIPPPQGLFGAKILYKNNDIWYYEENNTAYEKKIDYAYLLDCENRKECAVTQYKYGKDNVYILLPDSVYSELSKLSILALKTTSCKSIKIYIADDGSLNYKKTLDDSPCLLEILDIKDKLTKE